VKRPSLTIGIEEEYQIVDPETRELKSYITQFLEGDHSVLRTRDIKPEMHQSTIEIGTKPCRDIAEARTDLLELRQAVTNMAEMKGARIAAAGTHPFSNYESSKVTEKERYQVVLQDMGFLARDLLIFGMHVHVGIEDKDFAIDAMNTLRYFMPHVLALSTSSPFWLGIDTGLKSYRSAMFKRFPRTGLPHEFNSYAEYERLLAVLVEAGSIENSSKIYWDARPHHTYPTLEFRITDLCTNVDDALCCAALFQALVLKHYKMRKDNLTFRRYQLSLVEENKWRAMRYGIQGNLIDFGRQQQLPAKALLTELVEFVDDVVDDLGSRREIDHVFTILERGTSADQQVEIFNRSGGDLNAVVDWLIEETKRGSALA
jgi:carboxylate-amine ligase